jgi:hypothetical protein
MRCNYNDLTCQEYVQRITWIEFAILAGDQIMGKIASLRVDSPYSQA